MSVILLVGFAALIVWSLFAHRFERNGVTGPAALALIGAAVVFVDMDAFVSAIDSEVATHVVEIILAVVLFVDACEVKGGVFGGQGRTIARLLLIALPLSLLLIVLLGTWMLPAMNLFVLVVVACVVMPTDFSTAAGLLRSPRIPARLRQILNVESGYNDGVIAPIFGMALAIAVALPALVHAVESGGELSGEEAAVVEQRLEEFFVAFLNAAPATAMAILIGVVLGAAFGLLTRWCAEHGWADASGIRYAMLLIPLLTYGVAILPAFSANGFVAAFVAGVMFRLTRTRKDEAREIPHEELLLVEEAGVLASNFVWFVLGAMTSYVFVTGFDWHLLLIAAIALTIARAVPVYLAMLGSPISWSGRTLIGFVGPRGTATIVFGLLAFNALPDDVSADVLSLTVLTVVLSILLHGIVTPLVLRRVTITEGSAPR